jgi:Zn-dependent peptidase ImmA (M78 family)/DNA-binding XRE family transcriptional regulator
MSTPLEQIDPVETGARLRIAREERQLTQAEAAAALKLARTTLVAIEQGQRRVRIDELQEFSKLYNTSVNALLRREAVHVDLAPKFRKLTSGSDSVRDATQVLADLAKAEVELENLLGVQRSRNYPAERPIRHGDVRTQAEQDALELRQRLGLGLAPILDIVSLLELEMGIRVYVRKLDSTVSGLFVYDDRLGACILLNANHPRERRAQTAAHELGHVVSTRREPEIFIEERADASVEERYANAFARSFLMPVRAVTEKFQEVTVGARSLTRRHVILLAHWFGVSRQTLVLRLEELGLTKPGSWTWFEHHGGISKEHVSEVLGDLAHKDTQRFEAERPTSLRLSLLASEALRRELLSEGQLSRLLRMDRVELRELVGDAEGNPADDGPAFRS